VIDTRRDTFRKLKNLLKVYEPPFVAKSNYGGRYELWSLKDLVIAGRKRKEVYFAGLIIQSTYVGFYFMPVYTTRGLKKIFKKELLSTLKGKSCFHIKELDSNLAGQIRTALRYGFRLYKKRGWV